MWDGCWEAKGDSFAKASTVWAGGGDVRGLNPLLGIRIGDAVTLQERVPQPSLSPQKRLLFVFQRDCDLPRPGVPLNGIRRTMQEVADELAINH